MYYNYNLSLDNNYNDTYIHTGIEQHLYSYILGLQLSKIYLQLEDYVERLTLQPKSEIKLL